MAKGSDKAKGSGKTTCGGCGELKVVKDVHVPPPQEGLASSNAKLCATCASLARAK